MRIKLLVILGSLALLVMMSGCHYLVFHHSHHYGYRHGYGYHYHRPPPHSHHSHRW